MDIHNISRQYLDIANVIIVALDSKGKVTFINKKGARVLGYPEKEIIGRDWFANFLPQEEQKKLTPIFQRTISGKLKNFDYYEHYVLTRNGEKRTIAWHNAHLKDQQGKIIGTLSSGQDITELQRMKEALIESETRYRNLVEDMDDVIYRLELLPQKRFVYISPSITRMTGFNPEEYYFDPAFGVKTIHPEERHLLRQLEEGKWDTQKAMELRLIKKDGEIIWTEHRNVFIYDEQGRLKAIEGIALDITERKKTEEALRESEEKLKMNISFLDNIMDQSPFSMWISDASGTVIRTNKALRKALNLTKEQIVGKYNVFKDINLKEQGVMSQVRAVFEKKEPAQFSILWKVAKAGHVSLSGGRDLWLYASLFPVVDNAGRLLNVVCQWVDITKRKEAEEKLRASEKYNRLLVETMNEGFGILDRGGNITYVNKKLCDTLGYPKKELLGKNILDLLDEKYRKMFRGHLTGRKKGESSVYELGFVRKDGDSVIAIVSGQPLFDDENNYAGSFAVITEITDRVKMERDLQESQEQLSKALLTSPLLTVLIDLDEDRRLYVNNAYCDITGYTPAEVVGKTFEEFNVFADAREKRDLTKKFVQGEVYRNYEFEIRTKSGEIKVLRNHGIKLDIPGKNIAIIVAEDITAEKEAARILEEQKISLEQKNMALREMIMQIEIEKNRVKDDVSANINQFLIPTLQKMRMKGASQKYVGLVENQLKFMTSSFGRKITKPEFKLTPREIELCDMIKGGLTSKEISSLLNISLQTVEKHRKNIRLKLGLSRKDINLTTYLQKI